MARRPGGESDDLPERIAAAWRHRLKFRTDPPGLRVAVATLAILAKQAAIAPPGNARPFQRVGARRTRQELEGLARAVAARDQPGIVEACAALHAPAIDALADAGMMRAGIVQSDSAVRPALAERINGIAATVAADDPPGGRPKQERAHLVARVVLFHFVRLTTLEADEQRMAKLTRAMDAARAASRDEAYRALDMQLRPLQRAQLYRALAEREHVLVPLVADIFHLLGIRAVARSVLAEMIDTVHISCERN
jgi:hypothetical protein